MIVSIFGSFGAFFAVFCGGGLWVFFEGGGVNWVGLFFAFVCLFGIFLFFVFKMF